MATETDCSAVCIVGDSRSGSTIFQGLLELHRDVTAVGELRRLEKFIAGDLPCGCGEPLSRCGHWQGIIQRTGIAPGEIRTQPPVRKILRRFEEAAGFAGVALRATSLTRALLLRGKKSADHSGRLLASAAGMAQARIVVDNSKDPGHAVYLLHQRTIPVHIVFMVRDGRATVWSKMRRTGMSVETATRHWALTTRAMLALHRVIGPERGTWLRYEDLCADPRSIMAEFAKRLALDPGEFAPALAPPFHHIGGSPNFSGISFNDVHLDTRWRDEMPAAVRAQFDSIAGSLNVRLGYA